jgi:hypothetical protein
MDQIEFNDIRNDRQLESLVHVSAEDPEEFELLEELGKEKSM